MKWKRLGDAGLQKNWNGRLIHCTTSVVDYLKTKKLFLH